MMPDVPSMPCLAVKRATKVARNGFAATANMMIDYRCLVVTAIARNASNALPLIGLCANNPNYCPYITL